MRKITPARNVAINQKFTMIFLGDHDIPLTGSNFGKLTAFRAIFSHIFNAHAQDRPLMNFRLKFWHHYSIRGHFLLSLTMKDETSAAKFQYIKTVNGKVVEHSIAVRAVSIYWQGDDPFPWNLGSKWPTPSWRQRVLTHFTFVAPQLREIVKEVQLHLTRTWHGLFNEPWTKVLHRPYFLKMGIEYLNLSSFEQFRQ